MRSVNNLLLRMGSSVTDAMDSIVLGATPTLGSTNTSVTAYMGASWFN